MSIAKELFLSLGRVRGHPLALRTCGIILRVLRLAFRRGKYLLGVVGTSDPHALFGLLHSGDASDEICRLELQRGLLALFDFLSVLRRWKFFWLLAVYLFEPDWADGDPRRLSSMFF